MSIYSMQVSWGIQRQHEILELPVGPFPDITFEITFAKSLQAPEVIFLVICHVMFMSGVLSFELSPKLSFQIYSGLKLSFELSPK